MKRYLLCLVGVIILLTLCCAGTAATLTAAGDELPELQIALTSETVQRGEFLEVQILNLSEYDAFTSDGEYPIVAYVEGLYESYRCNRWGFIRIPTQNLNPNLLDPEDVDPEGNYGQFTLQIYAYNYVSGYSEVYAEKQFTVTEPPAGELYFSISTSEAVTREDYILSVYAPGAHMIEIYDNWHSIYQTYSDEGQTLYGYNYRGTYFYYAKAYFFDEEGTEYTKVSDTLTVEVISPNGNVMDPGVEMAGVLVCGEDLVMNVGDLTGFTHWHLNIGRESDGFEAVSMGGEGTPSEIRIPSRVIDYYEYTEEGEEIPVYRNVFEPGEAYNVELGFFRYGYHGFAFDVPLLVVAEETVTDSVEMTVNGQKGTLELAAHQDVTLHVKGPENATALLVYEGHWWQFYEGNERTSDWGWWTLNHIPEFLFFAKYTTDEIPDHEYDRRDLHWEDTVSNVVRVTNTTKGYLPLPQVQLSSDELIRGEWLTATITNLSDYADYQNIRFYAAPYYEPTGQGFGHLYDWDGIDTIRIPTSDLNPANRTEPFSLHVTVSAGTGWYEGTSQMPFTVVEPAEQTALFAVEPVQVETGEDFTISLYAPGAEEYLILENGNEILSGAGGSLTDHRIGGQTETRTYQAMVRYSGEEDWISVGSPVEVQITATYGDMPELILIAPLVLNFGEDLMLSYEGIDSVDNADLLVWKRSDAQRIWHAWGSEKTFIVSSVQPEQAYHMEVLHQPGEPVLEAGEEYEFNLYINKRGYTSQNLFGIVQVVDPETSGLVLRVNGETDGSKVEAYLYQEFEVSVTASDNVTAVRVRNNSNDWEYQCRDQDNLFIWRLGVLQEGMDTFIAEATTDQSVLDYLNSHHGDMEGFDWNGVDWPIAARPVELNVICYGDLRDPVFDECVPGTLEIGNDLYVKIVNMDDNATIIDLKILDETDKLCYRYYLMRMSMDFGNTIPERIFESGGVYRVIVETRGLGYRISRISKEIIVIGERPEAPMVSLSATEVMASDTIYATVTAAGAVAAEYAIVKDQIETVYFNPILGRYDMTDDTVQIPIVFNDDDFFFGTQKNSYHFRVLKDGIWSKWSPTYEIVVTEPPINNIIYLPAAVLDIEEEAFAGTNVEKVVIPASCVAIQDNSFAGCTKLREVVILGMDTVVSTDAFTGCGWLKVYVRHGSNAESTLEGWYNLYYLDD